MIRVPPRVEYPAFDTQVRQRGQRFLRGNPNPSSAEFRKHNYWSAALEHLYAAYDRMCAFTTRELVHTGSVDHYRPKSKFPCLTCLLGKKKGAVSETSPNDQIAALIDEYQHEVAIACGTEKPDQPRIV